MNAKHYTLTFSDNQLPLVNRLSADFTAVSLQFDSNVSNGLGRLF